MQIGIGIGITNLRNRTAFNALMLFQNSEQGVAFEPDPNTCFTDNAGMTPAGVGDAVAYMEGLSSNENYAVQPTAAARPILARVPEGGRRNLLTRTEEFDDGVWSKVRASITANDTTAPDGTQTADKLVESTDNGSHFVRRQNPLITGDACVLSFYAKAAERNWVRVIINETTTTDARGFVNVATGEVGETVTTGTFLTEYIGGGWYRVSVEAVLSDDNPNFSIRLADADETGDTYQGDGTSGAYIWGAQIELGSTATPYQRVGSTYDVTEAGKADKWHLVDGGDDSLPATVPDLGTNATIAYANENGVTILTGQTIDAGDLETLRGNETYGFFAREGPALTTSETANMTTYLEGLRP